MKIAFISDIHSNLEALNEVLEDIKNKKIDKTYCLGDLVGYGPNPNEVIEMIKKENIETIMGNYDDAVAYDKTSCGCTYNPGKETIIGDESLNWTIKNTKTNNKLFLKKLPKKLELEIEGLKLLLVHGSPLNNLLEYVKPNTPVERLKEIVNSTKSDIILNGHTHLPMIKYVFGKVIFNAGSVGRPKDMNPKTGYLILNIINNTFSYDFVRINYDIKTTCEKISKTGLPAELAAVLALGSSYKMYEGKDNLIKDKIEFKI